MASTQNPDVFSASGKGRGALRNHEPAWSKAPRTAPATESQWSRSRVTAPSTLIHPSNVERTVIPPQNSSSGKKKGFSSLLCPGWLGTSITKHKPQFPLALPTPDQWSDGAGGDSQCLGGLLWISAPQSPVPSSLTISSPRCHAAAPCSRNTLP